MSTAPLRNCYIHKTLFGLECPVLDTAYVVYNFYLMNIRRLQNGKSAKPSAAPPPAVAPRATTVSAASHHQNRQGEEDPRGSGDANVQELDESHSLNSSGRRASTILPILHKFIVSVVEMEHLPLEAASQRLSRLRFLSTIFASGLPSCCKSLVSVLGQLNTSVCEVLNADMPAVQPPRQSRLTAQASVRSSLTSLKNLRQSLEAALNEITEFADAEADNEEASSSLPVQQRIFSSCDVLYSKIVRPRSDLAEIACAVRTSLVVRSEEVVAYAKKQIEQCFGPLLAAAAREANKPLTSFRFMDLTEDILDALQLNTMEREQATSIGGSHVEGSEVEESDECKKMCASITSAQMLLTEMPTASRMKFDVVMTMHQLFQTLRQRDGGNEASDESALDSLCNSLLLFGVMDGEVWMQDLVSQERKKRQQAVPMSNPNASMHSSVNGGSSFGAMMETLNGAPKRTSSFRGSLSGPSHSDSIASANSPGSEEPLKHKGSSNRLLSSSSTGVGLQRTMSSSTSRDTSVSELMAQLSECVDANNDANRLYDLIGQVNLFLRRNGLSHETKNIANPSGASGKLIPSQYAEDSKPFLPHNTDIQLGFGPDESDLYTRACLTHEQVQLRQKVCAAFESMQNMSDNDFFTACHDDLLETLFNDANDACVLSPARTAVQNRLQQLMVVRIKLFHHSGDVRAVTAPQTQSLDALLAEWKQYFPDVSSCAVSYLDDGDRVMISTAKELRDLLRLRRSHVIGGMASLSLMDSSSLGRSGLNRSVVATSNDLKLELYLDLASAASPPRNSLPQPSAHNTPNKVTNANNNALPSSPPSSKPSSSSNKSQQPASNAPAHPATPKRHIFDELEDGMSLNEHIRRLDAIERQKEEQEYINAAKLIERRAQFLGVGGPSANSGGGGANNNMGGGMGVPTPPQHSRAPSGSDPNYYNQGNNSAQQQQQQAYRPNSQQQRNDGISPRAHPSPQQQQEQQQAYSAPRDPRGGPPQAPPLGTPSSGGPPPVAVNSHMEARKMFLQMGKNKPTDGQQTSTPAGGIDAPLSGSGIVVNPSKAPRWLPPKNEPTGGSAQFSIARHMLSSQHGTGMTKSEAEKYFDDDDDELEGPSNWNRGISNHVQAVMYPGGAAGPPGQQLRHNGPTRRSGVPLPPHASGVSPPKQQGVSPPQQKRGPTR